MATINKEYLQYAEVLLNVFTVNKGSLDILLVKKMVEPYKGYWCLPSSLLKNTEELDFSINNCIYNKTGISNVYFKQNCLYGDIDRIKDSRVLGISYVGLVDSVTLLLHQEERNYEIKWFNINTLPKLAYDHNKIALDSIEYLKHQLINTSTLKHLFPSDFTLPELQKIYEQLLDIKIDRRNFRKKMLNLDLIEDTFDYISGANGRPAKLYKFKDNIKKINLF